MALRWAVPKAGGGNLSDDERIALAGVGNWKPTASAAAVTYRRRCCAGSASRDHPAPPLARITRYVSQIGLDDPGPLLRPVRPALQNLRDKVTHLTCFHLLPRTTRQEFQRPFHRRVSAAVSQAFTKFQGTRRKIRRATKPYQVAGDLTKFGHRGVRAILLVPR